MDRLRKVSRSCRELCSRGLLEGDEACRAALLSALLPTLGEETPRSGKGIVLEAARRGSPRDGSAPLGATRGEVWVSEGKLLRAFNLQPGELRRHVQYLRSVGFPIVSFGGTSYGLTRPFDDLLLAEAVLALLLEHMEPGLPWMAGLPYRYLARCVSTNQVLKEEASRSPAGTVVVTDEQTGGRGRLGRCWLSGAGEDLTFSVLLRPSTAMRAPILSLAAALAVAEVLEGLPGFAGRVRVKWPNDVLVGEKKVCGILLESCLVGDSVHWAVAGIGLNVNSDPCAAVGRLTGVEREEWRGRAEPTSLRSELGRELARGDLLARLLARLTQCWLESRTEVLLDELRARDWLCGRRVEVLSGPPEQVMVVAGEAIGVGPEGELLVRDDRGRTVPVFGGEATVRTRA